ncbi:mucin-1-like [Oncorhynchus kisutch]|uniref:mucin-1-like n=1 Tax=Oncorhynchus kisutch TaxID=8019 RepID=UPI0012DE6E9D|nr:mucin-1-like [Oncorhynchus kisutch]
MIAYVDCLSPELVGGDGVRVGARCWKGGYSEDEDELLPLCSKDVRKMPSLQPKSEGSLRRRLLTSKIHQQRDTLWAPRPLAQGLLDNQGLQATQHRQDYPGPEPQAKPSPSGLLIHHLAGYSSQGLPDNQGLQATQHRQHYPGPEPQAKPSPSGLLIHHLAGYSSQGSQQHRHNAGYSLTQVQRTSYSPPTPDPHPGYSFPLQPPGGARCSHTGTPGYCNPGYCNPGYCNPAYCNTAYSTRPSSSSNPGHHNTAQGASNPSPGQGYGSTSSPPGPSYSSTLGFASQSQPSLPSNLPRQRKSFSPFNLLRRRSYNSNQIPFSHPPQSQDWRECDKKLRSDGYGSSQYFSQNPAYLSHSLSEDRLHDDKARKDRRWKKRSKLAGLSVSVLLLCLLEEKVYSSIFRRGPLGIFVPGRRRAPR